MRVAKRIHKVILVTVSADGTGICGVPLLRLGRRRYHACIK